MSVTYNIFSNKMQHYLKKKKTTQRFVTTSVSSTKHLTKDLKPGKMRAQHPRPPRAQRGPQRAGAPRALGQTPAKGRGSPGCCCYHH